MKTMVQTVLNGTADAADVVAETAREWSAAVGVSGCYVLRMYEFEVPSMHLVVVAVMGSQGWGFGCLTHLHE